MTSILIVIIYLSFISLGLPDTVLGSAWPTMHQELNVASSYAGLISMIIAGGTIISSLLGDKLIHKLGTGKVTAISVAMTAFAIFGFSISNSFLLICFFGIPYGFGAGSVDVALNNYVANHYKARHMSWLHCFWGIGATVGPYIMGACLTRNWTWNTGYRIISLIQIVLTIILVFSLPLWKSSKSESKTSVKTLSLKQVVKLRGAKSALIGFFCYCALESTTGLWGASFMVQHRHVSKELAASLSALFYLGITVGRFISGFITMKMSSKNLIRLGQGMIIVGIICLLLPLPNVIMYAGFLMIGLGCAPIYPSLLHETPNHFGAEVSQSIMGVQMACAYIGSTFMPPLFGMITEVLDISFLPIYLFLFIGIMVFMIEHLNKNHQKKSTI